MKNIIVAIFIRLVLLFGMVTGGFIMLFGFFFLNISITQNDDAKIEEPYLQEIFLMLQEIKDIQDSLLIHPFIIFLVGMLIMFATGLFAERYIKHKAKPEK